jgi:hypothetical protein
VGPCSVTLELGELVERKPLAELTGRAERRASTLSREGLFALGKTLAVGFRLARQSSGEPPTGKPSPTFASGLVG